MNRIVSIPLATLDEMFRPQDLPVGTYLRSYVIKGGALHLEWIEVRVEEEKDSDGRVRG